MFVENILNSRFPEYWLARYRSALLHDIESEQKQREWYSKQLEALADQIGGLPLNDNYDLQTELNRRQLEYEAQRVRGMIEENLGSVEQVAQRQEARLQRVRLVEGEMQRMQQLHLEQVSAVTQELQRYRC
ncbi:hypothetical protein NP493_432g02013 [Ridgeia piscesae]|uniref:Uncharacterized protein n=1 Tax=Ridgeia piscesae TaxID=27915 RepID=A0AAD9KZR0_RIDPI|nr:hypothetical protein NP493_432g02013 [Ridgeia piscesae]